MSFIEFKKRKLEELTNQFRYDDQNRCTWTISRAEKFLHTNPDFDQNKAFMGALAVFKYRNIRYETTTNLSDCPTKRSSERSGWESTTAQLVAVMRQLEKEILNSEIQESAKTCSDMEDIMEQFAGDTAIKHHISGFGNDLWQCTLYHMGQYLKEMVDEVHHNYYVLSGHRYNNKSILSNNNTG